jgi:DNA-binding SARP family transcriptional activator/tetratricopeptide (TPR) repeat protein
VILVELRLLGPVDLRITGRPVEAGPPQQRCVLAALAMTPRQTTPVEVLLDRVWGEQVPRTGRQALYTYLSRLRRLLVDGQTQVLQRRAGGYQLDLEPDRVDLHRARRLASQARAVAARQPDGPGRAADLLGQACDLWSGAPLAGLPGAWAERIRAALCHERLALLTERYEAAIRIGRHDAVLGPLSGSVADHPLAESLAGLLMLALYRSGRYADALRVHRELRQRLVDELGDEPGPALRRLHQQMLRRDPGLDRAGPVPTPVDRSGPDGRTDLPIGAGATAPWVPQRQLPPVVSHFVGRDREVGELLAVLAAPGQPAAPVATVTGQPGVGKTALAIRVAHLVRDRYPDGQWYVRLGDTDPARLLVTLLRASGVDSRAVPVGLEQRAATLRSRLADRRVLLLLDDAADTAQVRQLLPGTTGSAVLVTSRRQLAGLGAVTTVRLAPLHRAEATELLARLVGAERVGREPAATAEVSRACGGLPLALRIAAARLADHPEWTVARLGARLRDQQRRLDELSVDDLAVRAGLEVSYRALDPPLRAALRRLGAVGNDVATWTLGLLVPGGDGEPLVDGLRSANLLDSVGVDATGEPRYRLHELVATYAVELAGHDGQVRQALSRHLDALLSLCDISCPQLYQDTTDLPPASGAIPPVLPEADSRRLTADPWAWLVAESGQLVAAIERACELGWHERAALLAERSLPHLSWQVGLDRTGQLYTLVRDTARRHGDELTGWRAECHRCVLIATRGRFVAATRGLLECAGAFERLGAVAELAYSLAIAAGCRAIQNDRRPALALASRAVKLARAGGDRRVEVSATVALAGTLSALDHYQEALPLFERALALARVLGHRTGQVSALLHLATAAFNHADLPRCEVACRQALGCVDDSRAPRGVAWLLNRFARLATVQGRPGEAVRLAREAAARFARLGHTWGEATATLTTGQALLASGQPDRAVPLLRSAADLFADLGLRTGQAEALRELGRAPGCPVTGGSSSAGGPAHPAYRRR